MNADFIFVLDISDSITDKYLDMMSHFVKMYIHDLTIGCLDDRVGVVVFGDH